MVTIFGKQFLLDLGYHRSFDDVDYIVTSSNRNAYKYITQWPVGWHGTLYPNLVSLRGPSQSGKSHLGVIWARIANAKIVRIVNLAQDNHLTYDMQSLFDGSNILFDDVDMCFGHDNLERILFNTLNECINNRVYCLLIYSDIRKKSPNLPDLESRLNSILSISIANPDVEMLQVLIRRLFSEKCVHISQRAISYLASVVPSDFAAISEIINDLNNLSLSMQCKISINLIRQYMYMRYTES